MELYELAAPLAPAHSIPIRDNCLMTKKVTELRISQNLTVCDEGLGDYLQNLINIKKRKIVTFLFLLV